MTDTQTAQQSLRVPRGFFLIKKDILIRIADVMTVNAQSGRDAASKSEIVFQLRANNDQGFTTRRITVDKDEAPVLFAHVLDRMAEAADRLAKS